MTPHHSRRLNLALGHAKLQGEVAAGDSGISCWCGLRLETDGELGVGVCGDGGGGEGEGWSRWLILEGTDGFGRT